MVAKLTPVGLLGILALSLTFAGGVAGQRQASAATLQVPPRDFAPFVRPCTYSWCLPELTLTAVNGEPTNGRTEFWLSNWSRYARTVSLTIKNTVPGYAHPFSVLVSHTLSGVASQYQIYVANGLIGYGSITLQVPYSIVLPACGFTVAIDPTGQVAEQNESNNNASVFLNLRP